MSAANDVFVFGSNLAGRHGKGAALYAKMYHGARQGVGEGLTGNAYAIPTKDVNLRVLSLPEIRAAIGRFNSVVIVNPHRRFLLTPIGTGLAGYSREDIWSLLQNFDWTSNLILTSTWLDI